jgi:hypothetical protein
MRSIRRRKKYIHRRNISRNLKKTSRLPYQTGFSFKDYTKKALLPNEFTIENIERVLRFLNSTYNKSKPQSVRIIRFYMSEVIGIDMFTICLFLSLLNKIAKNVSCYGDAPKNKNTKKIFVESGFLDMVNCSSKRPKKKEYQNQMFLMGQSETDGKRIGTAIKEVVEYLTGTQNHYPAVYDIMMEICANSVEHANELIEDKNWLVSISYDNNSVCFILTDSGQGIINTLRRKLKQKFADFFTKSDKDVLFDLFNNEYQSRTGENNRHKGLPDVYEAYSEGYINRLMVLTNHVLYDFYGLKTKIFTDQFYGTMFSWSITKDNIELWYKKNCE